MLKPGAGFIYHISCVHPHKRIDEPMLKVLNGLKRSRHNKEACGAIRIQGEGRCHRCGETRPSVRLQIGDITPGSRATSIPVDPQDPAARAAQAAAATTGGPEDSGRPSITDPGSLDPEVPHDWAKRVRALPGNTLVHIPASCRIRMATAFTELLDGMARRLPGWSQLGEGFLKLTLAALPDGSHLPKEVAERLGLWQTRQFETLLRRLEMQVAHARKGRAKRRKKNRGHGGGT